MVYFHGGAFNRGAAKAHDTASMVAYAAPFVAVTFNYRLGALGFLNSIAAAEEGILNLGLHDQVLLLEWVQENIAAFGGDPTQVTIMGLSAGAHSVSFPDFLASPSPGNSKTIPAPQHTHIHTFRYPI